MNIPMVSVRGSEGLVEEAVANNRWLQDLLSAIGQLDLT